MVLCNLMYVKEYKGLMSQYFCLLNFVKYSKKNYYAYLMLALFGHDGRCKTIPYVVFLFKVYNINTNTILNYSQRSQISQGSTLSKQFT